MALFLSVSLQFNLCFESLKVYSPSLILLAKGKRIADA